MISDSEVVQIDLSNKPNLYEVNISYNYNLTTLDLSNCTNLYILNCYSNNLTTLDLSSCTNLYDLYCYDNQLNNLYLGSNISGGALETYNKQPHLHLHHRLPPSEVL